MTDLSLSAWPVIELDLLTASPRELDLFDCGYMSGYLAGVRAGHKQATDDAHAAWASMARAVARQGGPFARPFSEVCELRGEPARAARALAHEARVMAGVSLDE